MPWLYEPEGYKLGQNGRYYLPDFYLPNSETWVEVKGDVNKLDWSLLADAVDFQAGLPGTDDSVGSTRGLLILGEIPAAQTDSSLIHAIVQHHEGVEVNAAGFTSNGLTVWPVGGGVSSAPDLPADGAQFIRRVHSGARINGQSPIFPRAKHAYLAARSARFEHGHSGSTLPAYREPLATQTPDYGPNGEIMLRTYRNNDEYCDGSGTCGRAHCSCRCGDPWDKCDTCLRLKHACAQKYSTPPGSNENKDARYVLGERPVDSAGRHSDQALSEALPYHPVYSHIGWHAFDPPPGSDQDLAEAVAERMAPVLRYGRDTGTWLMRDADVWIEGP